MSTHTEHYHFLDLVRAIGILQVVLFHVVFGVFAMEEAMQPLLSLSNCQHG